MYTLLVWVNIFNIIRLVRIQPFRGLRTKVLLSNYHIFCFFANLQSSKSCFKGDDRIESI